MPRAAIAQQQARNRARTAQRATLEALGLSEARSGAGVAVRRKYGNQPTVIDGHHFDSKKEAERYGMLMLAQRSGAIHSLEVHPRFPLVIHEQDCGSYVADFCYLTAAGERVVEDVKSAATRALPVYRLKKRQVWALYGLVVREI